MPKRQRKKGGSLFLRKSVKLGPLRLNLSKSGVGASFGVKGARVGVKPSGQRYVHAGRHGLYYRANLDGATPEAVTEGPTVIGSGQPVETPQPETGQSSSTGVSVFLAILAVLGLLVYLTN